MDECSINLNEGYRIDKKVPSIVSFIITTFNTSTTPDRRLVETIYCQCFTNAHSQTQPRLARTREGSINKARALESSTKLLR